MKKILIGLGCCAFLLAGCNTNAPTTTESTTDSMTAEETTPAQEAPLAPVTINLTAVKNSGQTGTATFEDMGGNQTRVTLNLTGGNFTLAQPAHIHTGSCAAPGDVVYPLTDVVDGVSETVVETPMSGLWNGDMLVNVHKSAAQSTVYTACGDMLPATGAGAGDAMAPTEGDAPVQY